MPTTNEQLQSDAISHAVDLQRYSAGVVKRMIAVLNRADVRLMAALTESLSKADGKTLTAEYLESILFSARSINKSAYSQIERELTSELRDFAAYETSYQTHALRDAVPIQISTAAVSAEQIYAAAMARPFQGALLKDWIADQEAGKAKLVRRTVAQGVAEGKTTDQMVRELRGTRAKGYADGLLQTSRRDLQAVVQTATGHMAGFVQDRVAAANSHLVKAVRWVSTLDTRTSPICRVRDGKRYTPDTHKPIEHDLPWLGGPGRAHWRCRSAQAMVTKSWKELSGVDLPEFRPSTRASMDGQVPADTTYSDWIKQQSAKRQDDILGKDKAALFRTGGLPLDKFVARDGTELTLDNLKSRFPKEYDKAGLANPIRPPRSAHQDEIARFLASPVAQERLLGKLYTDQGQSYQQQRGIVEGVKEREGYDASLQSLSAVRYYTGNGFKPINQRTRETGGTLEDRQFVALTGEGLKGMPAETSTVYRAPTSKLMNADKWWDRAVVGEDLEMGNQLQSFSRSAESAKAFSGSADVLLRIDRPKGGVYIDPLSQFPGEQEVLFAPGHRYTVRGKSTATVDGKEFRVIDLEVGDGS